MKKLSKKLIATATVLGLAAGSWLAAPWAIKTYVEREYPGVTVERPYIRWGRVEFAGVRVVREPELNAAFDRVIVYRDKRIEVIGGEATYRPSPKDGAASGDKRVITVSGLRKLTVIKPPYEATFGGVRYAQGELCFDKAGFTHPKISGVAETGCAWKNKREAWAEKVTAHVRVPIGIPEFPDEGDVVVEKVHVWFETPNPALNAARVSYGPLSAFEVVVGREGSTTHLKAGEVVLSHPWLGTEPLTLPRGVEVVADDDALTQTLKPIKVTANGVPFEVFIPERGVQSLMTTCEKWVSALPPELRGPFEGIRWKTVTGSTNALSFWIMAGGPKPEFKIWDTCKADCSSPALQALRRKFTYQPYDSKYQRFNRVSGPGSLDWVPIGMIHPSMMTAAETCEDPGFRMHRGYIAGAFQNSLRDNLKVGHFLRGGSTITMQLAKNLWLYRDKTITRKLQEVLLAIALESCFSKAEIMALYLNVVEFGPDLYGIGPAAKRYFDVFPSELTSEQAFWLAMLLPRPRRAGQPNEAAMERVKKFMATLAKNGIIDEGMLAPDAPPPGSDAEWGQ
jgi:hypothetical protein